MLDAGYFVSPSDDGFEADEEDGAALDDMDEVGLGGEHLRKIVKVVRRVLHIPLI